MSNPSVVRWAEPTRIARAVREYAATLRREHPKVRRIYWYGSWVSGVPTPSSDVDLCVIVDADDRRPRDRVPAYLPGRFPVGVDLVVLTAAELEGLPAWAPSWYGAILEGEAL